MPKFFSSSSFVPAYAVGLSLACGSLLTGAASCKKNEPVAPATTVTAPAAAVKEDASCQSDSRVRPFAANLKLPGNSHNLTFNIVGLTPEPPAGGKNTWTVQILDNTGAPTSKYTLTVSPYMPDHGHGPTTAPAVAVQGNNYVVSNIDLFMGGVWRATFTAKDAQGNTVDAANAFMCVPG